MKAGVMRMSAVHARASDDELNDVMRAFDLECEAHTFGPATQRLLWYFQVEHGLGDQRRGVADADTAERLNALLRTLDDDAERGGSIVRGTVFSTSNAPSPHLTVRAYDRDLRTRKELGEAVTNARGQYSIRYEMATAARAEAGTADLQVVVLDDKDRLLVESAIRFNASADETIDLVIAGSDLPSEFEQLVQTITPLLEGQGEGGRDLRIHELSDDDLVFAAAETGAEVARLTLLRSAFQVGVNHKVEAAACYGLFWKDVAPNIAAIRQRSFLELRQLLSDALEERLIPAGTGKDLDGVLASFDLPGRSGLETLVGTLGLSPETYQNVVARVDAIAAIDEVTIAGLTEAGVLDDEGAQLLGLATSLHRLAAEHAPTVKIALDRTFESLGGHRLQHAADLARLSHEDWVTIVEKAGTPAAGASTEELATRLEEESAAAWPSIGMLHRALRRLPPDAPLSTIARLNPGVDLLALDLSIDSDATRALALPDRDEEGTTKALRELRTMQRVLAIAPHPTAARKLLDGGFHTATRIALATQDELVKRTGLDLDEAERIHDRAHVASTQAVHAWMAIRDAQGDQQLGGDTGAMALRSFVGGTQLARWTELFGSGDSCECSHCQSVLGPSAYYVDLLHYIEKYILDPDAGAVPAAFRLATRRRDLWNDPLISCRATNEIVPTLDLVNALLERWIQGQRPLWTTPALIHTAIADPANGTPSFALPVNFPLERLEILLAHFGMSRDRIVQLLDGEGEARVRARLKASAADIILIREPHPDNAGAAIYFQQLYRLNGNLPNGPGRLDQVFGTIDLGQLQDAMGLERDVVRALVLALFTSEGGSSVQNIRITLTAPAGAVQNTMEMVENLTRRRLDRLHRLARLWRRLPWTVPELDYVLSRRPTVNPPADLGAATLQYLVSVLDVSDLTALPLEEVMALGDGLPAQGFRGQAALFVRRFNAEPFRTRLGEWPLRLPLDLPLPITTTSTATSDSLAARVLSGLRMREADFAELVAEFAAAKVPEPDPVRPNAMVMMTMVTTTSDMPSSLRITTATLAVLYRHALLCRVLKVGPRELMRVVRLTPSVAARLAETRHVTSMDDVVAVLRHAARLRANGLESTSVLWLMDPTQRPDRVERAASIAASALERLTTGRLVTFPATLATAAGFTEEESRAVIARLDDVVVERSVQHATVPSNGSGAAPQELEYRLKAGVSGASMDSAIGAAIAPYDVDIATTAVLGLARELVSFNDAAFTRIFLSAAQSAALVAANLDDANPSSPRRPFLGTTVGAVTSYRLNPAYFTSVTTPVVTAPVDASGNALDLAGRFVLGALKEQAAGTTRTGGTAARTVSDTMFTRIFLSEQQSRWLVAFNPVVRVATPPSADGRAFLPGPDGAGTLLNVADINAATQPPSLADRRAVVTRHVRDLLQAFEPRAVADRVIAYILGVSPAWVEALSAAPAGLVPDVTSGLPVVDPAEVYGDVVLPVTLVARVGALQRLTRLFPASRFDAPAIALVFQQWAIGLAAAPAATLDMERILAVAAFGRYLRLDEQDPATPPDVTEVARRAALERLVSAPGATAFEADPWRASAALVLGASDAEVRSLSECPSIWQGRWHEQLDRAARALDVTRTMGISGRTLARIAGSAAANEQADELAELSAAADDIYGAFRGKYIDEAQYREKSEAFEDLIRAKRRDALVAWISGTDGLDTPSRRYAYFLVDTEVGGCARTSRLVAATMSLQLFVHRVLMGLEPARFANTVDGREARDQWYWRKNYRVWEANRKIFLFPENFLEPDVRDDKTPLFVALEEELLQRRITTPEAEEAFRTYLTGFGEVAGLKVVGAFHEVVTDRELGGTTDAIVKDVLHLVGVTSDDPPVHYLRRISNVSLSLTNAKKYPIQFSAWEQLETQIPAKWVTPIVHQRRLMLWWNEVTTTPTSRKIDGDGYFDGYRHLLRFKAITRRPDGSWTPPQVAHFTGDAGNQGPGVITDQLFVNKGNPTGPEIGLEEALKALQKDTAFGTVDAPSRTFKISPILAPWPRSYGAIVHHGAPIDSYSLKGWPWERVYVSVAAGAAAGQLRVGGGQNLEILGLEDPYDARSFDYPSYFVVTPTFRVSGLLRKADAQGDLLSRWSAATGRYSRHELFDATSDFFEAKQRTLDPYPTSVGLARMGRISDAVVVYGAGNASTAIIEHDGRQGLVLPDAADQSRYLRLTSALPREMLRRLGMASVPGLLSPSFQATLEEPDPGVSPLRMTVTPPAGFLRGGGESSVYMAEALFHIPYLLAHHLNSQQRFEQAQHWYHYLFNPTAPDGSPWRYREFATLPRETLRDALTNEAALAAYRNDPFNPHAIARLRLTAYQKALVMKYIDNLLDWGDQLFGQFTMESVNEATMLYVMAADILGERPERLPACSDDTERSYNSIKPLLLSDVSDFLIEEMEQLTISIRPGLTRVLQADTTADMSVRSFTPAAPGGIVGDYGSGHTSGYWSSEGGLPLADLYRGEPQVRLGESLTGPESKRFVTPPIDFGGNGGGPGGGGTPPFPRGPGGGGLPPISGGPVIPPVLMNRDPGMLDIRYTLQNVPPPHRDVHLPPPPKVPLADLVPARNIFCFPLNQQFLSYHERVQDRLAKIRNCMDITGVRRRLSLFAPEIDPMLLVRMRAAGLTLDDVLDSGSGHAPPYRFTFLLERARQYASTVQGLGTQLLGAMEKRDAEELAVLRTVHEQHLLELRTQSVRLEIDVARDSLASTQRQKESAQLRLAHFQELMATGLIPWEQAQQVSTHTALGLAGAAVDFDIASSIASAVPDTYAPTLPAGTTLKTGGSSVGSSLAQVASALRGAAGIASAIASSAGMEATFQRRAEDWAHQADMAGREVKALDKQVTAAEIRVAIAERALEVHLKSIEQARELYDHSRSKFSNLGMYTWLSTQLNRLHRMAYESAWNMARLAERALHFERPELRAIATLDASAWSPERAGLLAGDRLLLDLQRLEAAWLLNTTRQLEMEQSFSLAQYFPDALLKLRETGACAFDIPEFFYDLAFPGHYFRRVKAVRVTMTCVVGPHTSVGATLRMTGSFVRDEPDAQRSLVEVPLRHAPSIAVSHAQGDAGVFEFNFRDERLLPFEGMGAVSSWSLELPKAMRPFAYETISDVILSVSYTARDDGLLREAVDASTGAIVARLQSAMPRVALSLRRDFPSEWARFKAASAVNALFSLSVVLTEMHYAWWLRQRLHDEEDVAVHALYDTTSDSRTVNVVLGTSQPQSLTAATTTGDRAGRWLFGTMPRGKAASGDTSVPLALSFDKNDMSDVFLVLGPLHSR
jgi:hypothetical protein